jgi:hypothetical protein
MYQQSPHKNELRRNVLKKTASTVFGIQPPKVTATGSVDYPCVRHSAQKSPKGVAGIAQQVR